MKVFALGSIAVAATVEVVASLAYWNQTSQSTFQTGANMAQLISIVSLPLAAWAIVSAKRDLVKERRITFELDTLRAIAAVGIAREANGAEDNQETASRIRMLLLCLHDNEDLQLIRAALFSDPTDQALIKFKAMCPDAKDEDDWMNRGWRFCALLRAEPQTLRSEIQAAIERRVNR